MTFRSRWGWHPCDHETFQLLKRLHAWYWKALRGYAAWQRWNHKHLQNRVIREWVRDEQGNRVGRRVVGPMPEPPLCPLFTTRERLMKHFGADGKPLKKALPVDRVTFDDHGIPEAYRAARTPAPSPELAQPLALAPEEIRRLAAQLEPA